MTSESTRPDGVVIQEMDSIELKKRLDRGDELVLVDVREPFERSIADLPAYGQVAIPVKQIPFLARELDPEKETVVYCRAGPRSAWATERLMEMGFRKVINLKGGVLGWKAQVDSSIQAY